MTAEQKYDLPEHWRDRIKDERLWADFKIRLHDYERMLDEQGGVCAICLDPPTKRRLAVDHCHETGVVRGLLCHRCNMGIGYFRDNIGNLLVAAEYLGGAKHLIDRARTS